MSATERTASCNACGTVLIAMATDDVWPGLRVTFDDTHRCVEAAA